MSWDESKAVFKVNLLVKILILGKKGQFKTILKKEIFMILKIDE